MRCGGRLSREAPNTVTTMMHMFKRHVVARGPYTRKLVHVRGAIYLSGVQDILNVSSSRALYKDATSSYTDRKHTILCTHSLARMKLVRHKIWVHVLPSEADKVYRRWGG